MNGPATATRADLRFGDIDVALYRVADLESHVDRERLLGAGEVAEPPYWMHLWPGARALAARLAAGPMLTGTRVLEIGCGLGLPAIVAAARGGAVVASDRCVEPLAMLARSARLNGLRVELLQMDWAAMALRGDFDLLLGADVAYDAADEAALAAACSGHLRRGGRLLLADSVNTYRAGFAERLAAAGLPVRETASAESEDGAVVWVRLLEGVRQ